MPPKIQQDMQRHEDSGISMRVAGPSTLGHDETNLLHSTRPTPSPVVTFHVHTAEHCLTFLLPSRRVAWESGAHCHLASPLCALLVRPPTACILADSHIRRCARETATAHSDCDSDTTIAATLRSSHSRVRIPIWTWRTDDDPAFGSSPPTTATMHTTPVVKMVPSSTINRRPATRRDAHFPSAPVARDQRTSKTKAKVSNSSLWSHRR